MLAAVVATVVATLALAWWIAQRAGSRLEKRVAQWKPRDRAERWTAEKHVAILVNPNAGGGKGASIYDEIVKPMLTKTGVSHEVHFTKYHGHAKQIVQGMVEHQGRGCVAESGRPVHAIICVSGDGMLHECINGLARGCADEEALAALLPQVALAIVPAGSGNGVAASLYGRGSDALTVMGRIIDGKPAPLDTMAVRTAASPRAAPLYDVHFCCWACFADHDYLTERPLRWLGPTLKMLLAPAIVILRRRLYRGHVDFEPHADARRGVQGYSDPDALPPSPTDARMRRVQGDFWCLAVANLPEAGGDLSPTVQTCGQYLIYLFGNMG